MSSLLFLDTSDFGINIINGQRKLLNAINGYSFVLFYSNQCQYSRALLPIFHKLPSTIIGVHFGLLNINNNQPLIQMSVGTDTQLEYIPYMVFYVNGIPTYVYTYAFDELTIQQWILQVCNAIQEQIFTQIDEDAEDRLEFSTALPRNSSKKKSYLKLLNLGIPDSSYN